MLAFFITFWLTILVLLFIAVLYSIFAFEAIEGTPMFEEDSNLVSARDFIFAGLAAFGIAWLIGLAYAIYGVFDGSEKLFDRWLLNSVAYIAIFFFILVGAILTAYALSRMAITVATQNEPSALEAENNIGVALFSSVAAGVLILGGYIGYLYQLDRDQDLRRSCLTMSDPMCTPPSTITPSSIFIPEDTCLPNSCSGAVF